MPSQTLVNLMLAVVTAELLHAVAEMLSAHFKVGQLLAWQAGRRAPELPVHIDTRPKALAVLVVVALVLTGVSFAVFTALDLALDAAVVYTVVVVAATYAISGVGLDRFHVKIGQVGRAIRTGEPGEGSAPAAGR